MKIVGFVLATLLSVFLLSFLGNAMGLFNISFWGVKYENAKREVFEESQSFVEGQRQDLIRYHHEWVKAKPEDRPAIESVIRHRFANLDRTKITDPELQNFLTKILLE